MQQALHRLPSRFRTSPPFQGPQRAPAPRSDSVGTMELTMMNLVMRFVRDETGATAIEYGLIAAGISVSIIAVIQGIGSRLNATFTTMQNAIN
jgi:pilus assembly protein Flp/PilA